MKKVVKINMEADLWARVRMVSFTSQTAASSLVTQFIGEGLQRLDSTRRRQLNQKDATSIRNVVAAADGIRVIRELDSQLPVPVSFCAEHGRWEYVPADLDHDPHEPGPPPLPAPPGTVAMTVADINPLPPGVVKGSAFHPAPKPRKRR